MEGQWDAVQQLPCPIEGAREMLIFIHIPKTGGRTLETVIRRQYAPDESLSLSYERPDQIAAFQALSPEWKARLRCVMGHVPFGFHRQLPDQPVVHATLLRDPVVRFISEYRFLLWSPTESAWQPPESAMRDLDAYLDYRIATNAVNVQTSILSGYFPESGTPPPFPPLPADALERAKQNLREHFAVVGVTERYDETLLLLKRCMGWTQRVSYFRRNLARSGSSTDGVAPEFLARLREHTRADRELFTFAETLLTEALQREGSSPDFARELRALRRRNQLFHLLMHGWKQTPLWHLRDVPGIREVRHVVGTALSRLS